MKNTAIIETLKTTLARMDEDAATQLSKEQFLASVYHNQFGQDLQFIAGFKQGATFLVIGMLHGVFGTDFKAVEAF